MHVQYVCMYVCMAISTRMYVCLYVLNTDDVKYTI